MSVKGQIEHSSYRSNSSNDDQVTNHSAPILVVKICNVTATRTEEEEKLRRPGNSKHLVGAANDKEKEKCTQYSALLLLPNMYSASRHCFRSSLFRHTFSICSTRTHYHGRISSDYIVRSTGPDISLPNVSLYDMISKQFCGFGKNACIVNADNGREYSFYEMQENICNFSSNLLKMGFEKGDVLCIVSPNSPEYPAVLLGTLRSGGVVTACNPGGTGEEIASQISGTGAKVVATVPACLPVVRKALSSTGVAAKVIVIGSKPQNISRNLISYQCMLKHPGHIYDAVPTEPDSVAILPFSSGTTGVPKGVMLTNSNIASNILQLIHHELYDPNRNELSRLGLLPFFHMYGMSVVLLSSLYSGTKVVSLPKFDPKTFLGAIEKYKVRMAHVVPPILLFLAKHPLVKCYDLSSLEEIITSAAPIGTEIMKMAVDRTQSKLIRQAYGLTETTLAHMMPRSLGMLHLGSIGQCVKSCRTKVVDIETGDALPPNAKGELWINGPSVMKGYLNNPEATQASITEDGWFKTGDIGKVRHVSKFMT